MGNPVALEGIDVILDELRDSLFSKEDGLEAAHKVTLFQHKKCRLTIARDKDGGGKIVGWPWSGWLVPVARSGNMNQRSKVRFLAPGNSMLAQGVAGQAWASGKKKAYVDDLPTLTPGASDDEIEEYAREYAEKCSLPPSWVKKHRTDARSILGIGIPDQGGNVWGVLVFDSERPMMDEADVHKKFRRYGSVLSELVGGV